MAELKTKVSEKVSPKASIHRDGLNFYCWPCRTVHGFALKDVEKIVYTLVLDSADAWDDAHAPDGVGPQCLRKVLEWANAAPKVGTYAEQVEQGIECRERSDG